MLDGVFNHCGYEFTMAGCCEKGPNSKYYNWFMVNKWPVHLGKRAKCKKRGNYYSFAFSDNMQVKYK